MATDMSKEQLLRFVKLIFERHPSTSVVLEQFKDILKEEGAPSEYIRIVQNCIDGHYVVHKALEERGDITEQDIREAEAWYRKVQQERAGRC